VVDRHVVQCGIYKDPSMTTNEFVELAMLEIAEVIDRVLDQQEDCPMTMDWWRLYTARGSPSDIGQEENGEKL